MVDPAASGSPATMPEPLEAARRLSESILDRGMLEKLSRERATSTAPEAQARAASGVRESLAIDTSDAHAFSISYKDSDRERTQRVCNELLHHALERAPIVLADRNVDNAAELKRQRQTQELAAFIGLHPQVAAESAPSAGVAPDKDPALSALQAEKVNLERRVAELEAGVGSDNPYLEPGETDVKLLKRRLTEIDAAVTTRRDALAAKPSPNQLTPELRAEWKQLLDSVTQAGEAAPAPAPTLAARIVAEAPLPGSPIEPNRKLLLFFGFVFGTGLGAAFTLVSRAAQQRRSKSSRPPRPAGVPVAPAEVPRAPAVPSELARAASGSAPPVGPNMTAVIAPQVPPAPALPSGLGPAVPVPPPAPPPGNFGAPIVPIPQRPISSSPPGPNATAPNANAANASAPIVVEGTVVNRPPSDPPRRRFASTLVMGPGENPTPVEEATPDPVLASAARAWDDQIRAHEVPGFAVVRARSEPPPGRSSSVPPARTAAPSEAPKIPPQPAVPAFAATLPEPRPASSNPPPPATIQRTTSRPPNQMKVTQPLGSFLPDGVWNEPSAGVARSRTPQKVEQPPIAASTYSYVSNAPPAPSPPPQPSPPPASANVVKVQPVLAGWRPDPRLDPNAVRATCEPLYPLAVERCFVLTVVSVPESAEAKSRVAAEIALALSGSGHPRVMLLEGDFQRPGVQRMMRVDMPMRCGFSQQLRDRNQVNRAAPWTVMGCTPTLHVLAEGMMRTPGLLLSQHFSDCIKDFRKFYDFVVIDGPVASLELDSKALDSVVDGVLTVCPAKGSPSLLSTQSLFSDRHYRAIQPVP